jgi:Sortilin, neurotensin receptor 3,
MQIFTSRLRTLGHVLAISYALCQPNAQAAVYTPAPQPWQSLTPGAGGWYEAAGIGPKGLLVVASDLSGAYMSINNGSTWTAIGTPQKLFATHVSAVGFHKTNTSMLFLGTDTGIYRSTSQGRSFSLVQADNYITSIQFAPSNSNTYYAVGHAAFNAASPIIYYSSNSGMRWLRQASAGLDNARIQKLVVHPKRANELYAVSYPDRFVKTAAKAVYRSIDNGQTWTAIATDLGEAFDFAISTPNPSDMYIATTTGVHYSADNGTTWINSGQPLEFDYFGNNVGYALWLDPKNANSLRIISKALSVWDNKVWGIWQASKSGSSFSWQFLNGSSSGIGSKAGWEMPDYWHYATIGDNDLWSNFYFSGESLRTLGFDPRNGTRMMMANSQWVFNTNDGGTSFSQYFTNASGAGWRSRGIENVNVYDVAVSRWASGNVIFSGMADLGCWRSLDNGSSWESCNPVLPVITPPTPTVALATTAAIDSTSNGDGSDNTTLQLPIGFNKLPLPHAPYRRNARASSIPTVQAAAGVTYLGNWHGTGGNATSFAIDPARPGVVWSAMGDHINWGMRLLRSNSSGQYNAWQTSDTGIAPEDLKNIFSISIDLTSPTTQRTLFVTANGNVYRSTDDGVNWTKVLGCYEKTGNLNYCTATAVDFFNGKLVYAGGSAGLFVSKDGGDTWDWADSTHMSKWEDLVGTFYAYADRYLVTKIAPDPFTPNKVYLSVLDTRTDAPNRGGIWVANEGYNWQQLYATRYARAVAASPYVKDDLYAVSSRAFVAGGYDNQSLGVLHYKPVGKAGKWEQLNKGLSFNNASSVVYGTKNGQVLLGSMGQGVMRNWR